MKIFHRRSLPDTIKYNGRVFRFDAEKSALLTDSNKESYLGRMMINHPDHVFVIVSVMSRTLEGVRDLHGRPYRPSVFLYRSLKNKSNGI